MKTRTHTKQYTKPLAFATALLITLGFAMTPASAAPDFEGELNMRISTQALTKKDSPPSSMIFAIWMKQGKLRMEIKPDENAKPQARDKKSGLDSLNFVIIADGKTGASYMLMPDSKMYMVNESKGINDVGTYKHDKDDYVKTGRTDTILGWRVEEYVTNTEKNSGGNYTEMWLATGLGNFMTMNNNQGKQQEKSDWELFLTTNRLFPMKLTEYPEKGADQYNSQYEVTKVSEGNVSDSLFEIPDDYQKFDLGSMFGGLQQQMGDAAKEAAQESAKETAKEQTKKGLLDALKGFGKKK